jgi:hypothetical protein
VVEVRRFPARLHCVITLIAAAADDDDDDALLDEKTLGLEKLGMRVDQRTYPSASYIVGLSRPPSSTTNEYSRTRSSNASETRMFWKLMSSKASEARRLRPDRRRRSTTTFRIISTRVGMSRIYTCQYPRRSIVQRGHSFQ